MLRRLVTLAALILGAVAVARSQGDRSYRVKLVVVDHGQQVIEGKFVVMPDDLRIVCHGDPGKMFAGDYVEVRFKDHKTFIGKAECSEMKWLQ